MASLREWLAMSRHERRGALALLVLLVAAVVTLWLVRSRPMSVSPDEQQAMQRLQATADSMVAMADSTSKAAKAARKATKAKANGSDKPKKKQRHKKAASTAPQRKLEPVPQY